MAVVTAPAEDFLRWPDLASRVLGGAVVATNDDFFASVHNLITAAPAVHDSTAFEATGKVYDGWETRRRREPGTDWAVIRLAAPAVVHGVNVDTSYFTGNFPTFASVDGATLLGYPDADAVLKTEWYPLVEKSALSGDGDNLLRSTRLDRLVTHVRLRIHPDGGVARFRVHGQVIADPRYLGGRQDLAATLTGGRILACSNMFYSSPANALAPGRARVMSDGWETARRRDDGNDWLTVELAADMRPHEVVIDTTRFVGNAPGWATLCNADTGAELLSRTALLPDCEHRFPIFSDEPIRRVRLNIYPDGGISRLRVVGEVDPAARADVAQLWTMLLTDAERAHVDPASFFR